MRLLSLDLVNIGPFDEAHLDFRSSPDGEEPGDVAGVTFVTGENGTGKSIVIDAIRAAFGSPYARLSRPIHRAGTAFELRAIVHDGAAEHLLGSSGDVHRSGPVDQIAMKNSPLGLVPAQVKYGQKPAPRWVVDYWQSYLGEGSFMISSLAAIEHRSFLADALQGSAENPATTQLICHVDYLRDSRDPAEKRYGELLYQALQDIVAASLVDGRLAHVARSRLEPMFEQRGELIGIDKLSAGSLYMIQRMLGLLGRMYSCHVLTGQPGDDLLDIPGLLLIDEAENHLHPKWQKRFLPTIRKIFPNLQIVAATHSPFILASVPNARVYVCRAEDKHCTVTDVSAEYADRPIEDILLSPAFAETQPFSQEITELLEQRKQAIMAGDQAARERIESELIERNPEYFDYFRVDSMLAQIRGGAEQ